MEPPLPRDQMPQFVLYTVRAPGWARPLRLEGWVGGCQGRARAVLGSTCSSAGRPHPATAGRQRREHARAARAAAADRGARRAAPRPCLTPSPSPALASAPSPAARRRHRACHLRRRDQDHRQPQEPQRLLDPPDLVRAGAAAPGGRGCVGRAAPRASAGARVPAALPRLPPRPPAPPAPRTSLRPFLGSALECDTEGWHSLPSSCALLRQPRQQVCPQV